jgi:small-conductance mechanosensitive channel
MPQLRPLTGVLLGFVLGVLSGVLLAGGRGSGSGNQADPAALRQIEELTKRLQIAQEERDQADRQLERFQRLAEQMTSTFKNLEARFAALEAAERARETLLREGVQAPEPAAPEEPGGNAPEDDRPSADN